MIEFKEEEGTKEKIKIENFEKEGRERLRVYVLVNE